MAPNATYVDLILDSDLSPDVDPNESEDFVQVRPGFFKSKLNIFLASMLSGVAVALFVIAVLLLQGGIKTAGVSLRWKAKNRTLPGLTVQEQGQWQGPFFFIHGADPQLGLIDYMNNISVNPSWTEEVRRLNVVVDRLNQMHPKPKFFVVCGDLVNAYPQRFPERWQRQTEDIKSSLLRLDPSIPAVCVCGNHDIGNQPNRAAIQKYKGTFGDDFFSFWVGGSLFLVLNAQYYKDDTLVQDMSSAQEAWLDGVLGEQELATNKPKHIIAFLHIAPFKDSASEPEAWFNLGLEQRMTLLNKLFHAGVRKVFAGHFHQNAGGFTFQHQLEVVVTSAIGRVWGGKPGVRLVKVNESDIEHTWYNLEDIPVKIDF